MDSVIITEQEIEELAHKLNGLDLSEGERAFLQALGVLAARAIASEGDSDEVGGFSFDPPSAIIAQGMQPNELVIEQSKRGQQPSGQAFLVFKFSTVFTTH